MERTIFDISYGCKKVKESSHSLFEGSQKNYTIEEATWETKVDIRKRYPHLFIDTSTFLYLPMSFRDNCHSGMSEGQIGI